MSLIVVTNNPAGKFVTPSESDEFSPKLNITEYIHIRLIFLATDDAKES